MPRDTTSLSELERTVLGVLWRLGPVTPYRVRMVFVESPSAVFSGSAGAIYPLLRRLESRGLVISEPALTGKRASRAHRLTPEGKRALTAWLDEPLGPAEASDYDPIRVRAHFIASLPPKKRGEFLDRAELALEAQRVVIEAHCREIAERGDAIDEQAARGGLHTVRARIRWIREFRGALSE